MKYDKEIETMKATIKMILQSIQSATEEMKSIFEPTKEQNKKQEKMNQQIIKEEIENIKSQYSTQLIEMSAKYENEIKIMKNMLNTAQSAIEGMKLTSHHSQQLIEMNQRHNNEIESIKKAMKMMQQSTQSSICDIKSTLEMKEEQIQKVIKENVELRNVISQQRKIIEQNRVRANQIKQEQNIQTFEYINGHEFEGIFNHLNKIRGYNSHLEGIIKISSNGDEFNNCYQVIDKDFKQSFYPTMDPNSYLQFDFKEKKVSLSMYALRHNEDWNKLINWEIIGSNDCVNWIQIDEQHINAWRGSQVVLTYPTNNQDFYRYFRIRLKGPDSFGQYYLVLTSIEFFGKLMQ